LLRGISELTYNIIYYRVNIDNNIAPAFLCKTHKVSYFSIYYRPNNTMNKGGITLVFNQEKTGITTTTREQPQVIYRVLTRKPLPETVNACDTQYDVINDRE